MQLVVDKIAKAFGIHEIFKDVSFMVEQGEHVGLVGVNGSGKTTLLRCLLQPEYYSRHRQQNQGNFPPIYVRLINWRLHFGQRMLILPLPRGTRTTWRQPGQRK